jgi:hypothetical protein
MSTWGRTICLHITQQQQLATKPRKIAGDESRVRMKYLRLWCNLHHVCITTISMMYVSSSTHLLYFFSRDLSLSDASQIINVDGIAFGDGEGDVRPWKIYCLMIYSDVIMMMHPVSNPPWDCYQSPWSFLFMLLYSISMASRWSHTQYTLEGSTIKVDVMRWWCARVRLVKSIFTHFLYSSFAPSHRRCNYIK